MLYNSIEESKAGKYRDCNVLITGSEYELPKSNEIPQLMKKFCTFYSNTVLKYAKKLLSSNKKEKRQDLILP